MRTIDVYGIGKRYVEGTQEVQRTVDPCPWIAPCPVCAAVVQVTIETVDRSPCIIVKVDYACERKHATNVAVLEVKEL